MTKIENFGRANIRDIEAAMNEAHAKIAEQFGITIDPVNIRFNSSMFRISKLEGRTEARAQAVAVVSTTDIPNGYLPVGTSFQVKRTVYKIVAVNPHKPKNCYSVQSHNGAKWVCGADFIASGRLLKRGE